MSEVIVEPVAGRRCGIDEVFARPFIELITLAPRNPVVRGLILAQTGKMPEAERETYEQIKDWVETTCDKKLRPPNATRSHAGDGIRIKVEFSETEHGRANYSVPRYGTDEFALDADELIEMVQKSIDDGAGVNGVIEQIATLIDEDAWNRCDPNLDDYGDYDYDEHESNDSGNSATEFSNAQIRERLMAFLRTSHPDLLEELA
jgi:hypothetical protein